MQGFASVISLQSIDYTHLEGFMFQGVFLYAIVIREWH